MYSDRKSPRKLDRTVCNRRKERERREEREVREEREGDEGHFLCYGRGSKSMGEQAQNNL